MARPSRSNYPLAATQRVAGANSVRGRETRAQQQPTADSRQPTALHAFTLVEMLVAMAITLVMMAAVVTLFANVSNSVRNRRATIEMSSQIRHVRNVLQQDLLGATCPGLPWQRPESNQGYIEIIEGPYREGNASLLVDGTNDSANHNPEIDHTTSILPSSNLPLRQSDWVTDGGGLGDADDILMLTVRNEHEPFVGRMPRILSATPSFPKWESDTMESPLAEVVWFAIENPAADEDANRFFGEPGMRTIYRRTLLIAPWINPYREIANSSGMFTDPSGSGTFKAEPGLVRLLNVNHDEVDKALAALVAFQDRYDLSVRVEYDPKIGRWKIVANTLGDLTKRENRFGHFGFWPSATERRFPYALVSAGGGYSSSANVKFADDPDYGSPTTQAQADANTTNAPGLNGIVASYTVKTPGKYTVRPFAYVAADPSGASPAVCTAQAMLNDDGEVVRVVHGPVPLWGTRRGEDVMMTDALAFDLRVFDPGAPLFQHAASNAVLEPSDPAWSLAYKHSDNMNGGNSSIGNGSTTFPYVGQGAFVDLGYGYVAGATLPIPAYTSAFGNSAVPWFFTPQAIHDPRGNQLAPGYAVYDTWSFHYENNGRDDDGDGVVDQGTNGIDDSPSVAAGGIPTNGIDDVGERETAPPYDRPLRGVQVILRAYERDSRAIRQVRVTQHFMPE